MLHSLGEKISFVESIFGKANVSRDCRNIAVRCPICAPSDKSKRKLVIRTSDDTTHCWVCGFKSRSLIFLIKKFAPHRLEEYSQLNPKLQISIDTSDNNRQTKAILPNGFRLLAIAPSHDYKAVMAKSYVMSRGLSKHDLWRFRFGVCDDVELSNRVVVPSFSADGELNYYVARSIKSNIVPKYQNCNVEKTNIVFNELNVDWKKTLVVCEGVFDMFNCGDNAVPLLGSELTESSFLFERIVANNTPVALALDSDMVEKRNRFAQKLSEYDISVKIVDLGVKHDPGSMSKQEFEQALSEAKTWNWDTLVMHKLLKASCSNFGI